MKNLLPILAILAALLLPVTAFAGEAPYTVDADVVNNAPAGATGMLISRAEGAATPTVTYNSWNFETTRYQYTDYNGYFYVGTQDGDRYVFWKGKYTLAPCTANDDVQLIIYLDGNGNTINQGCYQTD